ncbi:MAG: carboxylesterase/lipase family protein [Deltaproteobacteria bacterium]
MRPARLRAIAAFTTFTLTLATAYSCSTRGVTPDVTPVDAADAVEPSDTPDAAPPPPPTVTLAEGTVQGSRGTGYLEFLGIPYAQPPVGALRWRPPVPVTHWDGTRDATVAPPMCPQRLLASISGQEDCLYVNVHVPDPAPHNAPVVVWIHGGAFVVGEGLQTDRGTRGDVLAATRGVVVVSMNYRLGPLGFAAHAALTTEGGGHSGNYGLLDQVAALQWVRDHAAAFGGDPGNVTLVGESAGGVSVYAHMVSPMSAGLFHRAVIESGPGGLPVATLATGETQGQRLATAMDCGTATDVAACMRAASVDTVLDAIASPPGYVSNDPAYARWQPVIDGAFFPGQPMDRVRAGTFAHVPVIAGWNGDEGTLFVFLQDQIGLTAAQYPAALLAMVDGDTSRRDRVLAHYPLSAYGMPWQALAAALGDFVIACPTRRALRAMAPFVPHAYAYRFTYPNAAFQFPASVPLGAFHSAEVQFVFGHASRIGRPRFVGDELAIHQAMRGYWTRFAASGDPNGEGAVAWPAYDAAAEPALRIDVTQQPETGFDTADCEFWESLGIYP